jgi:hypothetical protein
MFFDVRIGDREEELDFNAVNYRRYTDGCPQGTMLIQCKERWMLDEVLKRFHGMTINRGCEDEVVLWAHRADREFCMEANPRQGDRAMQLGINNQGVGPRLNFEGPGGVYSLLGDETQNPELAAAWQSNPIRDSDYVKIRYPDRVEEHTHAANKRRDRDRQNARA